MGKAFPDTGATMPGQLPDPKARRRNAPTIPVTDLPASGRQGVAPELPEWMTLGKAGSSWWAWAWSTPQACGWSSGNEPMIARRAGLEDDIAALHGVESMDFVDVLGAEKAHELREVVGRLAGLVTGKLGIYREMRELDDRLGLTPKGMAALRWSVVADSPEATVTAPGVPSLDDRRGRLTNAS